MNMAKKKNGWGKKQRAVVVAGVRTPFVKAFGKFLKLDSIDLSDIAVQQSVGEEKLDRETLDQIATTTGGN